jgi:hypothetical protein
MMAAADRQRLSEAVERANTRDQEVDMSFLDRPGAFLRTGMLAYDGRDRAALERVLTIADSRKAVTAATLRGKDASELERLRNELHVQLAAVNDALCAIGAGGRTRHLHAVAASMSAATPLDPSDPYPFG